MLMRRNYLKGIAAECMVAVLAVGGLLLFLELIGLLNAQWSTKEMETPSLFDVFYDINAGKTIISALIVSFLYLLGFAWYKGTLLRIIAQAMVCFIVGLLFSIIATTLIFNAWMHIHITTIGQWVDILSTIKTHTHAYHRFWISSALGVTLPLYILITWLYELIRKDNKVLGHAHFSSSMETYRAGFFKKEEQSIIIGKRAGRPLYANGFEHVLVFAPSGSGKTRSIAIPNLFHYPFSMVCNDVKFTLFETTSGFREKKLGHTCYCFAPSRANGVTHRYNPLAFISDDKQQRMTDIQRIAHILMPDNPKDPIWAQASRKLFKALVLFLLDTPEKPTTLGEINRLIKQQQFDAWLQDTLDNTEHYDAEFYRNGYSYINNHERTRSSILESFSGYFELFDDPLIDAATSDADFDFKDLRRKKMTIYVGFTDEDMERLAPLLTLFWQQLISVMIKDIPDPINEPYPLLCLIDEFSSLGRIERLRRSLKLLREYRVRCILMFQYIAQTYEKYSHDEAKAFTNIKTKIAYTTEDFSDAEFISKMLGTRTKRVITHSASNQVQGTSDSKSINYQAIPLLRPDELMKMSSQVSLIIRAGLAPVKAHQWIWYKEPSMKHLPCGVTSIPKQSIIHYPFIRHELPEKGELSHSAWLED
jgi:type IV secretion system protein VirD4